MADYNWSKLCCGAGLTSPHRDNCKENPNYEAIQVKKQSIEKRREQKFRLLMWVEGLWGCLLCGVVVHDPDLHRDFCIIGDPVELSDPQSPPRCKTCEALIFEDQPHAH